MPCCLPQVLATIHAVERARTDKPRNVLHMLSANTRRTKVVELSSGTHRCEVGTDAPPPVAGLRGTGACLVGLGGGTAGAELRGARGPGGRVVRTPQPGLVHLSRPGGG